MNIRIFLALCAFPETCLSPSKGVIYFSFLWRWASLWLLWPRECTDVILCDFWGLSIRIQLQPCSLLLRRLLWWNQPPHCKETQTSLQREAYREAHVERKCTSQPASTTRLLSKWIVGLFQWPAFESSNWGIRYYRTETSHPLCARLNFWPIKSISIKISCFIKYWGNSFQS